MKMRKLYATVSLCASMLTLGLCLPVRAGEVSGTAAATSLPSAPQQRSVQGTVTDASGPVVGATIVVEGTSGGTISDQNGQFTLNVTPGQTLVVSFIGHVTQRIPVGTATQFDVVLETEAISVDEVVVTALGIKREKKALGYAMQEVKGESIVAAREVNVTNALTGKVSGLQIIRSSNGPGGSSKIILRGSSSLTGDNQPLIVVDGVPMDNKAGADNNDYWNPSADMGNGLSDINPEDIESMSVLKGGSAAALYGSRAGNGVILITTKTGRSNEGLGITVSSSASVETTFLTPRMQSSFGQGDNNVFNNRSNNSWGPAIAGQIETMWNGNKESMNAYDNVGNYFDTGVNLTESVTFQQQYGKSSIYTSFTRMDDNSKIPGADYSRTNMTAHAVSVFGKTDRWTLDTKVSYIRSDARNRPLAGQNASNSFYTMYLLPRSMDIRGFEAARNEDGKMLWYGGGQQVNPYWASRYNLTNDIRDRFLLSGALKYRFTNWLDGELRAGRDMYTTTSEGKLYAGSPIVANGRYDAGKDTFFEDNMSFLFNAHRDDIIDRLGVAATFGGNLMHNKSNRMSASSGELNVPDLFTINNGVSNPTINFIPTEKKINSLYGSAQLNWDGYLFLDATFRNDWSSTMSRASRSYFYPSVSLSYVFTDMARRAGMSLPWWFSFAKLRGSFAQVGNDLSPYQLYNTYETGKDPNGVTVAGRRPTLYDDTVRSELVSSWEAGAELRFFNNRLGVDFAWYRTNATRQLINLPVDNLSGYTNRKINAGNIQNQGFELMINARIMDRPGGFSWDLGANVSRNRNTIVSLADGVSRYELGGFDELKILATAGGDYGEIYGSTFARVTDASSPYYGKMIVDENGRPVKNGTISRLGTQQASALAGITNTFTYKGFDLSFLIDGRFGGKIFSGTNRGMQVAGTAGITAPGGKRDKIVVDGVVASGTTYAPNTKEITTQDYWLATAGNGNLGIIESNVYDATNVRLRNVSLNYTLPKKMLAGTFFRSVKVGVSCNNVVMFKSYMRGIDPESVFATGSNATGFENAASPTSRTYLFNISFGL